jgi:cephalosporin hydroxylase
MGLISKMKKIYKERNRLYMEENLDLPVKKVLEIMQEHLRTKSTYFGVPSIKSPTDSWTYQEIIYEMKPDVIVEVGNETGGSTLMLAHLCDLLGKGKVIGVDISHAVIHESVKKHPRITLIEGDACGSFEKVKSLIKNDDRVLVIEDSSHTYENTLNVLRTFSELVRVGDYFIVEDSNCHHGLDTGPNPGPYEAIEKFISENKDFTIDRGKEAFFITWNPKGYLKRVR